MMTNPAAPDQSIGGAAPQTLTLDVMWEARDEVFYQEFLKANPPGSSVLPSSRQLFICYVYNARADHRRAVLAMEEPEVEASQL